jgi:glucuronosyltransferase
MNLDLFRLFLVTLVSCDTFLLYSEGAKILFLVPIATRSEKHFYEPLIFELGRTGHSVTVVTSSLSSNLPHNVTEIMPSTYQEQFGGFSSAQQRYSKLVFRFLDLDFLAGLCHKVFNDGEFQKIINEEYDLVFTHVFYGSCFYGVLHKIGAPFILFDSFPAPSYLLEDLGSHMPSSFVPYSLFTYSNDMTFPERVGNFLINWMMYIQDKFIVNPKMEMVYRQHLGDTVPSVTEIHKNASMFFMNSHFTSTYHRPIMPDLLEIGGIHCRPANPLPKVSSLVKCKTNHIS